MFSFGISYVVTIIWQLEIQSSESSVRLNIQDGSLSCLAADAGFQLGAEQELLTSASIYGLSL